MLATAEKHWSWNAGPSWTRLGHHQAAGSQSGFQQLVELPGVQHIGRATFERVRHVDDRHVEGAVRLFQELEGVDVLQLEAGIVEGALVVVRELLAAQLHHLAVYVHHDRALDAAMRQDLPRRRAFAAARHEHVLGSGWETMAGCTRASW